MITTILTDRTNYANDIKDIQQQWLGDLLCYMGLDAEGIKEAPRDLAVEYLIENNIEIIEHVGLDALEVRVDGEVIGEWATPELKLKIDKADELYFEINIEHWSIIEEDIEEYEER